MLASLRGAGAVKPVLPAKGRKRRELAVHGHHRQAVFANAVVWITPDGAIYAKAGSQMRSPQDVPLDAADAFGADLPGTLHQQEASAAQGLPLIERLWRSLKYECIYMNAFETGSQARA